jgi:hypothetical protein
MLDKTFELKKGQGPSAFKSMPKWPLPAWGSTSFIFEPSNPVIEHHMKGFGGQELSPAVFYERAIIAWVPEFFFPTVFPNLCPPCPQPGCSSREARHVGWIDKAVDVFDVDRVMQVVSRR